MLSAPRHPDRRSVDELVEELRDEAIDLAPDLNGIPASETVYGEAAQVLEEYGAALAQIAAGADDPKAVAVEALSLAKALKPIRDAGDAIRGLLRPRST
jgi:hypothetical protein